MKKVSIVGAGLVGSLLSVYMAKRGYKVDVFERRPDFRQKAFVGGRSINLAMSDRGWRALKGIDLDDQMAEIALPMYGRMVHNEAGKTNFQPYGNEGQAIYSISRGMLNLKLVNATEPDPKVNYHFNLKCKKVDFEANTLTFEAQKNKTIKEVKSDIIIGADGAFSAVRWQMQKSARFNFSQQYLEYGYKELEIPANADGTHQLAKDALHIWPRKKFMLIALPNLDGSFTCTLFLAYQGAVSFKNLNSDEEINQFFEEYFADAKALMPDLVKDFNANPTGSLITIKCQPWHNNQSILIGDASHAIVPFYGQGMNSGFEDCTILNELMEQHKDDWQQIPQAFSKSRKANADAISDLAMRNFVEMRDLVADDNFLLRKAIEKQITKHYPDKYMPLYSMVTFSQKPYAEALAEGLKQDALFAKILKTENLQQMLKEGLAPLQLEKWLKII